MPIHFEPPSWRPFCAASRSASAFISASNPPIASISARSSAVRCRSASRRSQSGGRSSRATIAWRLSVSAPAKTAANTRS